MVLLLRKLYLYFTKDPEGVHYFPGGGVSGPPIPLWIRTWTMPSQRDNIYHSSASNHDCQAFICQD